MECEFCNHKTSGIVEDGALWCDECGRYIRKQDFVRSHNNFHVLKPIYNRVKRFHKFVQATGIANPRDWQKIADVYSRLEFVWMSNRKQSYRTYFYAWRVMFQVCCSVLGIKCSLHLKDATKEQRQFRELEALTKTKTWEQMYGTECALRVQQSINSLLTQRDPSIRS